MTHLKDEVLKLALEALEGMVKNCWRDIPSWRLDEIKERITAIKQALAAPVQPVASLKEVDVLMMAETHGIDPSTKGLYGFYIDCISNHPVARPAPVQEPVAAKDWEGAEYWMPLAWELCANECGEEACTELVWEGGPIPEPWGERWLKYEDEAKSLIALVQKHTIPPAAQPAVPLTDEQIDELSRTMVKGNKSVNWLCRAIEAALGITAAPEKGGAA
jgi:hypothetical protein